MKVKQLLIVSTALACLLAGCATPMTPEEKKVASQVAGGVTGAAIGSLFGSGSGRVIMTGAGAVLGTVVGGQLAE
jgi:uncharacterized protein YcfJ